MLIGSQGDSTAAVIILSGMLLTPMKTSISKSHEISKASCLCTLPAAEDAKVVCV